MSDRFRFRAWHKLTKKLFDVFSFTDEIVFENTLDGVGTSPTNPAKLADCVLEQCTGLKDKNGELIYEGDLLKIAIKSNNYSPLIFDNLPVIYKDGSFGVMQERIFHCLGSYAPNVCFEVIGNIHKNPEILEEK